MENLLPPCLTRGWPIFRYPPSMIGTDDTLPWYSLSRQLDFFEYLPPLPGSSLGIAAGTKLAFPKRREGKFFPNFFLCHGLRFFI